MSFLMVKVSMKKLLYILSVYSIIMEIKDFLDAPENSGAVITCHTLVEALCFYWFDKLEH